MTPTRLGNALAGCDKWRKEGSEEEKKNPFPVRSFTFFGGDSVDTAYGVARRAAFSVGSVRAIDCRGKSCDDFPRRERDVETNNYIDKKPPARMQIYHEGVHDWHA